MTALDATSKPGAGRTPLLFVLTIFGSAALVFMVEPMIARLLLPLLGGGPSIWNTSLAFFQAALLAGYGYAHLLQKVRSLRAQQAIHIGLLALAAMALPVHVTTLFGEPRIDHPVMWLLGVLTVSIGGPFAMLSATAPLVQSWHARAAHLHDGAEPYALYAASNLGSLIALVAYPAVVEPFSPLHGQTLGWSVGYGAFLVLMAALALSIHRAAPATSPSVAERTPAPSWRDRAVWVLLAAAPSSLMLGVTTFVTTDVASAPFLWVVPLALYLLTFIVAFADRQRWDPETTLVLQAAAVAACAAILPFAVAIWISLPIHLGCFFLTALVCHQALVARRPHPDHLTEFYLWMSLGGVVGGGFNAFVAPVVFNNVWEYPLVLIAACLARPWGRGPFEPWRWATLVLGAAGAGAAVLLTRHMFDVRMAHFGVAGVTGPDAVRFAVRLCMAVAIVSAFVIRRRALAFCLLLAVISLAANRAGDRVDTMASWRNFFGVLKESRLMVPGLGGETRMLAHGTTLHGAQALNPAYRCRPLVYYAPETPIGQVFTAREAERPALRIGAVGLGTGAVAAYVRAADHLTFFEIDPQVVRISGDPRHFSYTTECARGAIGYVLGDARFTLARQPPNLFDILLIDAFSSDSVPAHLLTVEAVKGYLGHLKPDGVLILHLSNRNLDLVSPAMAVAHEAGGCALVQRHKEAAAAPALWESSEDAVIVGRTPEALTAFARDPRWEKADPTRARAWTDDYTNLMSALVSRTRERLAAKP